MYWNYSYLLSPMYTLSLPSIPHSALFPLELFSNYSFPFSFFFLIYTPFSFPHFSLSTTIPFSLHSP